MNGEKLLGMDQDGKSDPYISVLVGDKEGSTEIRRETTDPVWDEDLLFIIPFEEADMLLGRIGLSTREGKKDIYESPSLASAGQGKGKGRMKPALSRFETAALEKNYSVYRLPVAYESKENEAGSTAVFKNLPEVHSKKNVLTRFRGSFVSLLPFSS